MKKNELTQGNCDCEPFQSCQECSIEYKPKFEKPGKPKKKVKTKDEKNHHDLVASIGCIICRKNACIHHIRISGEPRDHKKVIPLCYNHHQGKEGIHTIGKHKWREIFGHELDYLDKVNSIINSL